MQFNFSNSFVYLCLHSWCFTVVKTVQWTIALLLSNQAPEVTFDMTLLVGVVFF